MKYALILMTSYGDGWSEGSMIRIKKGNTLYVESRVDTGFDRLLQWERDSILVTTTPVPDIFCEHGIAVNVSRVGTLNAMEESFQLYEIIDSHTTKLIYEMNTTVEGQQIFSLCLQPRCHLLVMHDTGDNGWSEGSLISFFIPTRI